MMININGSIVGLMCLMDFIKWSWEYHHPQFLMMNVSVQKSRNFASYFLVTRSGAVQHLPGGRNGPASMRGAIDAA